MPFAGLKRFLFETKAYAGAAANLQISMKDHAPFRRLKYLIFRLDLSIVQPGTATAITGKTLIRLFKSIRIGRLVYVTGSVLSVLGWMVRGLRPNLPADVPATASTTFQRTVTVVVPWSDDRAKYGDDTAQMSQMFRETPIQVDLEAISILAPTNTPAVTGTLRVFAYSESLEAGVVPSLVELGYTDWSGQRVLLDGDRVYTHLAVLKEDGSALTSAEITGLTIAIDGEQYDNVAFRAQDAAYGFDWLTGEGTAIETASATAPVAGESLTDEPPAAGGGGNVSMEFLPLIVMGHGYLLSKAPHATKQVAIDFQGSLTSFRLAWRAIVPRSELDRVKLAAMSGAAEPGGAFQIKTGSKAASRDKRLAAILPLRYRAAR